MPDKIAPCKINENITAHKDGEDLIITIGDTTLNSFTIDKAHLRYLVSYLELVGMIEIVSVIMVK